MYMYMYLELHLSTLVSLPLLFQFVNVLSHKLSYMSLGHQIPPDVILILHMNVLSYTVGILRGIKDWVHQKYTK